jgi:ribosome-associated toxin RatA of RatAB toxin-antitoxin module
MKLSAKRLSLFLLVVGSICCGRLDASNIDSAITVEVSQANGGFEVRARYFAPLSQCQAYALLTDFSQQEPSEGVKSSKAIRLSENTVRVEQRIEDKIGFFSTQFDSVIDYTKNPMTGMDLRQVKGYFKEYRGSWRLTPNTAGTIFSYDAFILPNSAIPMFVIEYFMNARIQKRFEKMAQKAKSKSDYVPEQCR